MSFVPMSPLKGDFVMSIRKEQLVYEYDSSVYIPKSDFPHVPEVLALSFIRHILRERSDSNIIPIIRGIAITRETNEYGHDCFIEVTYSTKGYRATYAGKSTFAEPNVPTLVNVQCYMD